MRASYLLRFVALLAPTLLAAQSQPQTRPRGRELGIPFPGTPGPLNAITDVAGVAVGHTTLVSGDPGPVVRGTGPIRTGVTAILPRAKGDWDFVMAATFNQNGNGDMTGVNWVKESGFLEGPILLTGTHSVGTVRDATIEWQIRNGREFIFTYPLVTETFDVLNDATGAHVKREHAWAALDAAKTGAVREGGVGGGTGMSCNGFKGGIGTSSRQIPKAGGGHYTLGILVQCNYGGDLAVLGAPVGRELQDISGLCTVLHGAPTRAFLRFVPKCKAMAPERNDDDDDDTVTGRGSIIIIIATDAPMLPHQLERIAKRAGMGLGKLGSAATNGSGDLFLAFSTVSRATANDVSEREIRMLPNDALDPYFRATIHATEEAVVNAMLAADTMVGADGLRVMGLPGDRLVDVLRKYKRMP
ncbi:P1 family peptidase [Gemmatimonas sp.]|uniref:DmpA family aminopeptidase n=1 Tax=Gemmatimonas sp. TaxID=1962908 RepID=UPI00356351AC